MSSQRDRSRSPKPAPKAADKSLKADQKTDNKTEDKKKKPKPKRPTMTLTKEEAAAVNKFLKHVQICTDHDEDHNSWGGGALVEGSIWDALEDEFQLCSDQPAEFND
jgi:hypothetical protein